MEIKSCRLADGGKVKLTKKEGSYVIEFEGKDLQPINTIVEIETTGNVMDIKPMEIRSQSLSFNKKVNASSNPNPDWNGVSSISNGDWVGHFWMPSKEDKTPWVEIDLGKPEKLSKAIIYEHGKAVKTYELQYQKGEAWKTMYKGTTIGSKSEIKLPKVTAQKIRLLLTGFCEVPGIYEIVLL
jgi:hypothetical protein